MKALSHVGMIKIPNDQIHQIFRSSRGLQYYVICEEVTLSMDGQTTMAWAYRVQKDYGNVFYADYLKKIMGDRFVDVMGPNPKTKTEKCGDVVEMWLGLLDVANMTTGCVKVINSQANPGELLTGLEASMRMFQGPSRSTSTINSRRRGSRQTETTPRQPNMKMEEFNEFSGHALLHYH